MAAVYRTQLAPFIAQGKESWRAGELWIADHKQLDLICRWSGANIRPWLSAWMDWRTRRVAGWVLSDNPNSTTILASLRHGLKDEANFGGPRCVWLDNGKDYTSWMLHGQTKKQRREEIRLAVDEAATFGILNALKIEAHFATPYNPNGKARLERWFRTLESFCKTFPTYTGDSIESKPERLNEIIASPRLVPTFETVRQRITDHIAGNNVRTDHGIDDLSEDGLTISPDEAMARWCDTRRIPADADSIDLLMAHWHKPVTVQRNGISICLAGQTLHYGAFEPALIPFKSLSKDDRPPVLIAYDPHDLRSVRVHDAKWRYVCTVAMNQIGGMHGTDAISMQHVADLNRQKATYEKSQRHVAEHSLTSTFTTEERLAGLAADSARPALPTPPPQSMQIVQTPLDGQAQEIELDQFKQAAGSESMPIRRALPSTEKLRRNLRQPIHPAALPIDPLAKLRRRNHAW